MLRAILLALGLSVAASQPSPAQSSPDSPDSPVVVELFTSQGCSSCPPADALFAQLANRSDVLALALHVDYWDYLGWKDAFGDPAFTERQKAYARVAGARSIFTPQMVVQGMDHLVGVKPMELGDLIRSHALRAQQVSLSATRAGGRVNIVASARLGLRRSADVQIVQFIPLATSRIERGENAGQTVTYTNIVETWQVVGTWDGRAPLSLSVEADKGPLAVIIQEQGPGPILAAARLR
ncbi:MAG: DUF1223 domain-containing protein [Rhodobacteraceae bacterium]|nr:DUF1223 domain-containing protein [Paracoccaceae bacterium]